jgi:hypothetical protein
MLRVEGKTAVTTSKGSSRKLQLFPHSDSLLLLMYVLICISGSSLVRMQRVAYNNTMYQRFVPSIGNIDIILSHLQLIVDVCLFQQILKPFSLVC